MGRDPHMLFLSRWILVLYVRDTRFHASIYLSIHIAMHFCSELSKDVPGLLMHFLKHFSDIFVRSSWAFAIAICCFTWSINSSFCTPLREPVVSESILVVARYIRTADITQFVENLQPNKSKVTSNFQSDIYDYNVLFSLNWIGIDTHETIDWQQMYLQNRLFSENILYL